jgi:S-adenosylmethionine:tRNA ribosyltransferase-isomerase
LRVSKAPKEGARLRLDQGVEAEVTGRSGEFYTLFFNAEEPVIEILQRIGHMPLPPYITRGDTANDRDRYQTLFSRRPGAVAAPTAGLHFDEALLEALRAKGVLSGYVTLHVGAGTFQPVRVEDLREHRMHREFVEVSADTCTLVDAARARGNRVIAVGTTVVRALEVASRGGEIAPYRGETDLFITPGYRFRCVDALLTNFHMPESTLLMLVCAFGGTPQVLAAYRHAVARRYRFYSYGDAMFLARRTDGG